MKQQQKLTTRVWHRVCDTCESASVHLQRQLGDALLVIDPRRAQKPPRVLSFFLALLVLLVVSAGMLWLGDKFNAQGVALTRFMARAQAPLTASYYPGSGRDRIAVFLYDRQFLSANQLAWPLSYQQHADGLLRLAQDPAARPKALFLDVTFGQQRLDPTLPALREALCTLQNVYRVPVFLAALASPETGQLTVRDGLAREGAPCFTLVGVDYLPDTLDGTAWTYQLTRHLAGDSWQAGPAPMSTPGAPAYRSAALAMAQDAGGVTTGPEKAPMALVWGKNSAAMPAGHAPDSLAGCRQGQFELSSLVPGFLRPGTEGPLAPLCPYHATLSMDQVNQLSDTEIAPYLKDRFVLVGAQVPGQNDFATSPVQGLVPGIHMHAMALDNLLVYGPDYKLSEEWSWRGSSALWLPALFAVMAVFAVQALGARLADVWRRATPPGGGPRWVAALKRRLETGRARLTGHPRRYRAKTINTAARLLGWLLSLSFKTIAAMLMIVVLQRFWRIGMLPVVELVSMTLVAEALGLLDKLRDALVVSDGEPPAEKSGHRD